LKQGNCWSHQTFDVTGLITGRCRAEIRLVNSAGNVVGEPQPRGVIGASATATDPASLLDYGSLLFSVEAALKSRTERKQHSVNS
jgi:hypothetical protein